MYRFNASYNVNNNIVVKYIYIELFHQRKLNFPPHFFAPFNWYELMLWKDANPVLMIFNNTFIDFLGAVNISTTSMNNLLSELSRVITVKSIWVIDVHCDPKRIFYICSSNISENVKQKLGKINLLTILHNT